MKNRLVQVVEKNRDRFSKFKKEAKATLKDFLGQILARIQLGCDECEDVNRILYV